MSFYRESEFGAFGKRDHESFINRAASEAAYQGNKMAKKDKSEAEVTPPAAQAEAATAVAAPATSKDAFAGLQPGRIVHFHRDINTGNGAQLVCLAAMVVGPAAKESNLPAGSVDVCVFSKAGQETRFGVMYSEKPKGGYWSWAPRA